jgi:hypothetical protein
MDDDFDGVHAGVPSEHAQRIREHGGARQGAILLGNIARSTSPRAPARRYDNRYRRCHRRLHWWEKIKLLLSGIGPKRQFGQALFALAKWSGSPYSAQMKGIF